MQTTRKRLLALALAGSLAALGAPAQAAPLFWSTQAQPIEETQAMREQVLAEVEGGVDYQASDPGPWLTRLQAEIQAGSGTIALLGALHGDFAALTDALGDVSDVGAEAVLPSLMELGRLGTDEQKYIPWMQATYVMAANRQALDHLPEGTDLDAMTYDELTEWMRVLAEETGGPKFGSPPGRRASSTASSRDTSCRPIPARW